MKLVGVFLFFFIVINDRNCIANGATVANITDLLKYLNDTKYDKKVHPDLDGPPVEALLSVVVCKVGPVDEIAMTLTATLILGTQWYDQRLADLNITSRKDPPTVKYDGPAGNILWQPDIWIEEAKEITQFPVLKVNPEYTTVRNKGSIRTNFRAVITFHCDMNFRYYPFDQQACNLTFGSHSFGSDHLQVKWNHHLSRGLFKNDISGIRDPLSLPGYINVGLKEEHLAIKHPKKDVKWDVARASFSFERDPVPFIIHDFVPSSLLVAVTWTTFFIPPKVYPARVTLIVVNLLASNVIFQSVSDRVAKNGGVTAMEIYLMINILFIVAAMVEYIVVLKFPEMGNTEKKISSGIGDEQEAPNQIVTNIASNISDIIMRKGGVSEAKEEKIDETHSLDRSCRIIMPVSYLMVVTVYFFVVNM